MKIIKDVIKSALISIMMSMCIFVIVGVVFDQIGNGVFKMENYQFSKMVLACVITGLGFGVPTFLYSVERIPMFLASIIHLGIGRIHCKSYNYSRCDNCRSCNLDMLHEV